MSIPDRQIELIGLSDLEFLRQIYDRVWNVAEADPDLCKLVETPDGKVGLVPEPERVASIDLGEVSDDLYGLLTEAFERFAPDVERAYVDELHDDEPEELDAWRRSSREREGARMIRRALGDDAPGG